MLCPKRGPDSGVVDEKGSFAYILWKDQNAYILWEGQMLLSYKKGQ